MITLGDISITARDGSLDDDALEYLWAMLVAEGTDKVLFYDGGVEDFEGFTAFVDEDDREFFAVHAGGAPAAIFWLDGRTTRAARIHFACMRRAYGRAARIIGNYVTDWLLSRRGPDGRHALDVLVGVTPETHRLALKFVQDIGFTLVGTVPHALPLADGSGTGAVISHLSRKEA